MINKDFKSIVELITTFSSEEKCVEHLEALRWNGNPVSPFDNTSKVYKCAGGKYKCKNTGKYFNVRTNTIFDNTKMPLVKWFCAIWLATSHKKGISSVQLSKDLDITQKSAWFMLQRIRNCFGFDSNDLDGDVEVDETYIGGKDFNRHAIKKKGKGAKITVVGMVERGGRVVANVTDDSSLYILTNQITEHISTTAHIITDEWRGYGKVKTMYNHSTINHSAKQYVDGLIHTNTIAGFWSLLKRGIIGIYHFVSHKHLQRYINEFTFRYNTRELTESARFNLMLSNCENRLTYNNL